MAGLRDGQIGPFQSVGPSGKVPFGWGKNYFDDAFMVLAFHSRLHPDSDYEIFQTVRLRKNNEPDLCQIRK